MGKWLLVSVVVVHVLERVVANDLARKVALFLGRTEGQQLRMLASDGRFAVDRYGIPFMQYQSCICVFDRKR